MTPVGGGGGKPGGRGGGNDPPGIGGGGMAPVEPGGGGKPSKAWWWHQCQVVMEVEVHRVMAAEAARVELVPFVLERLEAFLQSFWQQFVLVPSFVPPPSLRRCIRNFLTASNTTGALSASSSSSY